MSISAELLDRQIASVYQASIDEFRLPAGTDMSRSNKCHTLTIDLYQALLRDNKIRTKREFHINPNGYWHYLINHSLGSPSDEDLVTDLNPWQFAPTGPHTGYLHGQRSDIQEILRGAGADETFIALRGLATIGRQHHDDVSLPQTDDLPIARIG